MLGDHQFFVGWNKEQGDAAASLDISSSAAVMAGEWNVLRALELRCAA
ncbi:hypothetical protein I6F15_30960 [Bradyrhizobium sp. BRP14]|nr:hypothetical protein [Bradyrhizobium sp. BRP14]